MRCGAWGGTGNTRGFAMGLLLFLLDGMHEASQSSSVGASHMMYSSNP